MVKAMLPLLIVSMLSYTYAGSVFPTTRNGEMFTNMLAKDGVIFIAENGLLHSVDKDLNPIGNVSTCNGNDCENINKIILAEDGMFILGGTGNNGILQAWNGSMFVYNSSTTFAYNYLTVSSDINRSAVGLVYDGNLYLGATFGDGIAESDIGGSTSYRYMLSVTRPRDSFNIISYVYLKYNIYTDYIVYFRAVFRNHNFVYFLTNQKADLSSQEYVTKLIRICVNETYYTDNQLRSYKDIKISCNADGVDYNLLQDADFSPEQGILVAAFAKGGDPENPMGENVVCIYTIEEIDQAILDAQKEYMTCSSHDNTNDASSYLKTDLVACLSEADYDTLSRYFICPQGRIGVKVIGKIDLQATSNYKLDDIGGRITKVKAIDRYDLYPDVYLGTNTGSIIRLSVDGKLDIHQYTNVTTVDTGHVVTDIHVDHNDDFLYVLTDRKLFKVDTLPCEIYNTYMKTVQTKNPSCGWCMEEHRYISTKRTDCSGIWISSMAEQITIDVSPKYIAAGQNMVLKISTTNIPTSLLPKLKCRYMVDGRQIGALLDVVISSSFVQCYFPGINEHNKLSVELVDGDGVLYAEETIQIYICEVFKSCATCQVSEEVDCLWCSTSLRCSDTCEGETNEIGKREQCTTLIQSEEPIELYIPAGVSKRAQVSAKNLVDSLTYKCAVNLASEIIKVNAQPDFSTQTISCNIQVPASLSSQKIMVPFHLLQAMGTTESIVFNEQTQYVTIYECESLAEECSICKALNKSRYDCEWCNGQCRHHSLCSVSGDCPQPRVTNIQPAACGNMGGTEITISGTDFGNHVVNNITVGDRRCFSIRIESSNSSDFESHVTKIYCRIARRYYYGVNGFINVTVTFSGTHVDRRADLFSLKVPIITSVTPSFSPAIGGTVVTMSGTNLGIGDRIRLIFFGSFSGLYFARCLNPNIIGDR